MRLMLAAVSLILSCGVVAQPHSAGECREGSDFIRNAALSRDSGTTRAFFVRRLEEDLVTIRAFPRALRWFVYDAEDEQFLRGEVEAVFDTPLPSEQHRADFLQRCSARSEKLSSPNG